jgi:uncharacterized protein (DUF1800 family)
MQAATTAAHRFGFSETSLRAIESDPRGWTLTQMKSPEALDERGLLSSGAVATATVALARSMRPGAATPIATQPEPEPAARKADRQPLREARLDAMQRHWQHTVTTSTPVYERWVMFWANHFCVAATKGSTLGMVSPHEREAIRPNATGRFRDLLRASTLHPAMLLYLDNAQSIGPNSRAGRRRERGLNENLARELLELHTLGRHGGDRQADVGELAKLLTGWSIQPATGEARFNPALHEPGDKTVLGRRYREGPEAVEQLFTDLSREPATARHVSTKLARHFITDHPPLVLVDALAARFRETDGDLMQVAVALFSHPAAWQPDTPSKFKRPDELLLSAHRMLKLPIGRPEALQSLLTRMGQPPGRAPSPQGWPDTSDDWLAPDALWKRVQWADQFASQRGDQADARLLAGLSYGRDLSGMSKRQIDSADSGAQALAVLLASPEFQRR